jgi:hypothetical protein
MARARLGAEWAQTSAILALLANVHRDPKKKRTPYKPSDFDPFAVADKSSSQQVTLKPSEAFGLMFSADRTPIVTPRDS